MDYISIDNTSSTPIYKQIISSICNAIDQNILKQGDLIPSANKLAAQFSLARGSVFNAYNELKATGIIDSRPGKGYYIVNTTTNRKQKILLLLDSIAPYKEILYNSFITAIGTKAKVDVYFHHFNIDLLASLINQHQLYYNAFVVAPPIHRRVEEILESIPRKQLYILDLGYKEFGKKYPSVCQNFEKDIFQIMQQYKSHLDKYQQFVLVLHRNHVARGIIRGFTKFCKTNQMACSVQAKVKDSAVAAGACFIVIQDNDLVELIWAVRKKGLKPGKEVGIISYNETPLKSVIGDGIATISTDFQQMGKTIADMVLNRKKGHFENACQLILRESL